MNGAPAGPSQERVALRLLGDAAARASEGAWQVLARKDAALLAILAIDGPTARERLLGLLWPDAPRDKAQNSLRQRVHRLRSAVGSELVQLGETVRLAPGVSADAAALHTPALSTSEPPAGDLLGGFDYGDAEALDTWVGHARERWRAWCVQALDACSARQEQGGDLALAIRSAERLVGLAPTLEQGWRRLMRLHWQRADRPSAVAAFERCERALKDEAGLRPSAETVRLLSAIEQGNAPAPPIKVLPPSLTRPPRLVGRDDELAAMRRAWDSGRSFLLVAEAGMGKSRLLQEFMAHDTHGIAEQARPGDENVPHALLVRVLAPALTGVAPALDAETRQELARLLPGFGPAPQAPAHPVVLRRAVEQALADATDAGLRHIVLDDLHCADEASLEMLLTLMASPRLQGLRFGLAMREPLPGSAGMRLLGAVGESSGPQRVPVAPLGPPQLAALLASLELSAATPLPALASLAAESAGNPLYALEILRDHVLRPPGQARATPANSTVLTLLRQRLRPLPPDALALARLAAVAGADFTVPLAVALTGESPLALSDRWATLQAAHVLDGVRFTHDLVAHVLAEDVPPVLRAELHAQVAAELQAAQAPAGRVAAHWALAQRWGEAGEAWERAAVSSAQLGRVGEQCAALREAAAAYRRQGEPTREFDALALLGERVVVVEGMEGAQAVTRELLALAPDPLRRVRALVHQLDDDVQRMARLEGVVADAGPLIAECERLGAHRLAWKALCKRGLARGMLGQIGPAVDDLSAAQALAERHGGELDRAECLSSLSHVLMSGGRLNECRQVLIRAIGLLEAVGDPVELNTLTGNLAVVEASLGHQAHALRLTLGVHRQHARHESSEGLQGLACAVNLGRCLSFAGRYREALACLTAVRRQGAAWVQAIAAHAHAGAWISLGQYGRARDLLEEDLGELLPHLLAQRHFMRALLARRLGQPERAEAEVAAALKAFEQDGGQRLILRLMHTAFMHPADALRTLDDIVDRAELQGQRALAVGARAGRLACLAALGNRQSAPEALRVLRRVPDALNQEISAPEAWLACARVLQLGGRPLGVACAIRRGRRWLAAAREHVDTEYLEGFERGNPTHRALLAWPDPTPTIPQ